MPWTSGTYNPRMMEVALPPKCSQLTNSLFSQLERRYEANPRNYLSKGDGNRHFKRRAEQASPSY